MSSPAEATGEKAITGGTMAVERAGSGEPMVLLHGVGSNRHIWGPVMPALAERFEVFALDLPGFGDSPPLAGGDEPSVPALARAVELELERLGVGKPHLVGNSMGGWIAFELARRGRAHSVVAISPVGLHTRWEARLSDLHLAGHKAGARLSAPLGRLPFRLGPARSLLLRRMFARPGNVSPEAAALANRKLADSSSFTASRRWISSHRPEGLDQLTCPVLIAWGTKDRLLPARQGPRWVAEIPGAKLRLLPGLGHLSQSDDPDLVSSVILDFALRN
jgi:pimeloyl-ACP methyl ester carboxylesterase